MLAADDVEKAAVRGGAEEVRAAHTRGKEERNSGNPQRD